MNFDHGEDFFTALADFWRIHGVRQGYIPMFIAGMRNAELVGSCEELDSPDAPVWTKAYLDNAEAFGGGTLAYDPKTDCVLPHIHVSVGPKAHSATAHRSPARRHHPVLTDLYIVEVTSPRVGHVKLICMTYPY